MIQNKMNMLMNHYKATSRPGSYSDHKKSLSNIGSFNAYARTVNLNSGGATMSKAIRVYTMKANIEYGDYIELNTQFYRVETIDLKLSPHSPLSFYQIEAVRVDGI